MKRLLPSLLILGALTACGGQESPGGTSAQASQPASTQVTTSSTPSGPPPAPEPAVEGTCPYLDKSEVAQANGQLVPKVMLSSDKTNPACFFYANATEVQLTVRVYRGDATTAKALVNEAAPIADSNPATEPAGWEGGSMATDAGAVYAVAKAGDAVVITSNQKQTIKAKQIAKLVVQGLAG